MQQFHVGRIVEVADAQQLLSFVHALFGQHGGVLSFVYQVFAGLFTVDFFAFAQLRNNCVGFVVLVGGFVGGAGNDQRSARFVDQNGIHFVHDGKVVAALHAGGQIE